jgi:hypothetical protein
MRGYLILAGLVLTGTLVAACARSKPMTPAHSEPVRAQPLRYEIVWTYVIQTPSIDLGQEDRSALESHPSFMGYLADFPEAYLRDACLRGGWDRPITVRGPYVDDANHELTKALMQRTNELRNAEAQWRAIQENHGVFPKTP